tara:strand:+ start:691 stop:1080 length:390 start_codon:yes stop_codon:yes gene_type:complete
MSENKNTLAKGMFVREHTFNSGTKVLNVSINVADFCSFVKDNMNEDSNGNQWVNLKLIPNKNVGENKLSHTPILNDYVRKTGEQALDALAAQVVTPSAEERAIVETPTKKTKRKAVKKAIKKAVDNLPF